MQQFAINPKAMAEIAEANKERFLYYALNHIVEQAKHGYTTAFIPGDRCCQHTIDGIKERGFNIEKVIGGYSVKW